VHTEFRLLPLVHDRLDNVRRQQRQPQDAVQIAPIQLLRRRQFTDRPEAPVIERSATGG